MSIEKLVEECARATCRAYGFDPDADAITVDLPHDKVPMWQTYATETRAVIRRTLEYAAGVADKHRALVPDHDPDKPVPDAVGQGYGNAALNLAAAYRFAARSLPKAEGERGATPPKSE